jgi:IS5 family transposase
MTYWHQRIDEERIRLLLAETIRVAKDGKAITEKNMSRIMVDTTGREKNIVFPTDAKPVYQENSLSSSSGETYRVKTSPGLYQKAQMALPCRRRLCVCESSGVDYKRVVQDLENWPGWTVRDIRRKILRQAGRRA